MNILCIQLTRGQKITATNTWNFALIDYFADMTLLRNGPDDQSESLFSCNVMAVKLTTTGINFQKASCTLDGCVKIWTSRVDSVATETGKLLSGLAGGGGESHEGESNAGAEKALRHWHALLIIWADLIRG